jgi:hypothetical protein
MQDAPPPAATAPLPERARETVPEPAAASVVVVDVEDRRPTTVGIRQEGGSYKSAKGSDFLLWNGKGGAPDHLGNFNHVGLYGALDIGRAPERVRHFFGHGDTIFYNDGGAEARGVCLGFAQKKGKPYDIIVDGGSDKGTFLIGRGSYVRLVELEPPANANETKVLLE